MYHVILWSSLLIAVVSWFAVVALFNMDVGHDSMLYSKVLMPPPPPFPRHPTWAGTHTRHDRARARPARYECTE